MSLDRNSPIPLYHQIEEALLAMIRWQKMTPGSRLPSETEMASRFKVTRLTVRQAAERLEQRGVIVREKGRGTFVVDPNTALASVQTLTLILPDSHNPLHLAMLAGAEKEAHEQGLQIVTSISENDPELERQYIEMAVTRSVGLILGPLCDEEQKDRLVWLQSHQLSVVLLDCYYDDLEIDRVVVDNFGGAYQVTEHLAGLGHRRIAFIYGPGGFTNSSTRLRRDGYMKALRDHGLNSDKELIVCCSSEANPKDRSFMELLAKGILQLSPPVTSAFCANDYLAQAFLVTLRRSGVSVPEDFSVVGFDGLEHIPVHQRLTTVRRATHEMGAEAVRLLARRLQQDGDGSVRHVVLPTKLILGETTAVVTWDMGSETVSPPEKS